jgi:HD-GYP domain-containing protein (c-di-GMP phosphodiesterase class II)
MNLGMLDLQQRLARQATPLTAAQREQVEAHPEAALAALSGIGVSDEIWLASVGQHHEKPGGQGYPRKLATPGKECQLLRLADVFCARASARADRRALAPAQLIRALFVEEAEGPCAPLVAALVKTLGFYPPGSYVKLASGEIAVVFRNGAGPKTPIVAAVTNAGGLPTMQPVRRDTDNPAYAIVGTLAPDTVSVGYDLGKLWLTKAA